MKTCPVCGFNQTDLEKRCVRCSGLLPSGDSADEELDGAQGGSGESRIRLGRAGAGLRLTFPFGPSLIWGRIAQRYRRLAQWLAVPLPEDVPDRRVWVAGFLGLIPGLGQLYNHQPKKALYFAVAWTALGTVCFLTIRRPYSNYLLAAFILWMAYAFHDGVKTALTINRQYWTVRRSVAAYFAWIFQFAIFCIIAQYVLTSLFVKFVYVGKDDLEPFLLKRERVAVDMVSYRFRPPRVGEVVFYNPARIRIERGSDIWIINPRNSFERVLAGPGQTFERRQGRYYRDGVEVSASEEPIVQGEVNWDYKLTAPEDHYIVLFSHTSGPHDDAPQTYVSVVLQADGSLELREENGTEAPRPYSPPVRRGSPSMSAASMVHGWNEACIVPIQDIVGRVWFVYHPPVGRRFIGSQIGLQ